MPPAWLSQRAGRGVSQQLATRTFVLTCFALSIIISSLITWSHRSPAKTRLDDGAPRKTRLPVTSPATSTAAKPWTWSRSKARRPWVPGSALSRDGDFVAAYFTEPKRHKLIEAGRKWRRDYGVRTVVVSKVEAEAAGVTAGDRYEWGEVWQTWPDIDDKNGTLDVGTIAFWPGDHRGAMTPVLAHRALGDTYKWMLYGDDDSVFFPEGLARVVEGLDPNLPYFIGDRSWGFGFGDGREFGATPRCVPCNWNPPEGTEKVAVPVPPLRGCPCDRITLCKHWNKHFPEAFPANCTAEALEMPVPHHMTFHGGGGTILSVGLLRQLDFKEWQDCVESMKWRQGSDSYVTKCIWRAGFGMTDSGYSYMSDKPLEHFVFDRWTFRGGNALTLVEALWKKIMNFNETAGFCRPDGNIAGCTVPDEEDELLVTMASVHGVAQMFEGDMGKAAKAVGLATKVYRDYIDAIAEAHPEVMRLNITIGARNP